MRTGYLAAGRSIDGGSGRLRPMEPLDTINRYGAVPARSRIAGHVLPLPVEALPRRRPVPGRRRAVVHHRVRAGAVVDRGVRRAVGVPGVRHLERANSATTSSPTSCPARRARWKPTCASSPPTRGKLTAAGIVALVISLLITLTSVEATFNRIWRVKTARPKFARFLVYWTVFTLGALVAATSLALSSRFFAMAMFATGRGSGWKD
jgi:hypothetical protein